MPPHSEGASRLQLTPAAWWAPGWGPCLEIQPPSQPPAPRVSLCGQPGATCPLRGETPPHALWPFQGPWPAVQEQGWGGVGSWDLGVLRNLAARLLCCGLWWGWEFYHKRDREGGGGDQVIKSI